MPRSAECEGETPPVLLRPDELEVLRLIDLVGLQQEEAAAILGVSRKTVWRDLHEARREVTGALVHGRGIEILGCRRHGAGRCDHPQRDRPQESEE